MVSATLDEEYDHVESALIQLENICEKQELQNAKLVDSQKLAAYRNRKMDDLEKLKGAYNVSFHFFFDTLICYLLMTLL